MVLILKESEYAVQHSTFVTSCFCGFIMFQLYDPTNHTDGFWVTVFLTLESGDGQKQ